MKHLFTFVKLFTGALFVFSGIVKLNDPAGFAIKLDEYFDVFADDVATKQDSVQVTVQFDFASVSDESFPLYASDRVKKLSLNFSLDSLNGSDLGLNWGGLEGTAISLPQYKQLPAQLHVFIKGADGITAEKTYSLDSLQQASNTFKTHFEFNVEQWVKPPGFLSALFKSCKNYSLYFSLFFCALEVWLGLALLLGYEIRLTVLITALLIGFFTFLTAYSAYYNKVTDCGCFGDFLKLKPWQSFKKDVILLIFLVVLRLGWNHNRPILVRAKAHIVMAFLALITLGFGFYCYYFLPIWDFLPYKKGNDIQQVMTYIPTGERATDSIVIRFVMQKGTDSVKVSTLEYADFAQQGYVFVRQDRQVIEEGYKSPIHDFAIYNLETGEDLKETFLTSTTHQMVYIMPFLSQTDVSGFEALKRIHDWSQKQNWNFYGLSSASLEPAKAFKVQHELPFAIYAADQKMLMTMARYNPTLYVFKGSVVLAKYSGCNLPDIATLQKLIQESQ